MDADKLNQLEEKLYSETLLIGDHIRQQAAKQLAKTRSPQTIKILTNALAFSNDKKVKNIILSTLRQIKIQEEDLVNSVCEVWAESRDLEIGKLIKIKGWLPSQPLKLRLLVSLYIDWNGIIEEQKKNIILPLFECFDDLEVAIADKAKEWAVSFTDPELQEEVCRLCSEEKNQKALQIANQAGYAPQDPSQAALFYYMTEQWEKYTKIDPQQKLLENIYYSSSPTLRETIDQKGKLLNRIEWVWTILGGKQGRRLASLSNQQWEEVVNVLINGKKLPELWSIAFMSPTVWTINIIKKLQRNKWLPKKPEDKVAFHNWIKLVKNCGNQPPKGKLVRCSNVLEGHTKAIESTLITPDGNLLISAGDEIIRVWDLKKGELLQTLKGHVKSVTSLALNETGDLLVSGSRDKTLCAWRLPEGNLVQNFSANVASAWCVEMTSDTGLFISGSYQETRLWQFPAGKLYKTLRGHKREVQSMVVSPDNSILATGGGTKDNTVRLWELPSGNHLQTLEGHTDGIWCMAISPDNSILATGSKDHTIKLWSLPDGQEIRTLEGHTGDIWCLAISPDGQTLATGSKDKTVKLWSISSGKLLNDLQGHKDGVWCLTINQDGDLLATGSRDKTLRLWQLPEGENVGVLKGHTQPVRCLGISPDSQTLVSASSDRTLRLWTWDLPRLCSIPISVLTKEDRQCIKEALSRNDITKEERYWLNLLNELIHNYLDQLRLKLERQKQMQKQKAIAKKLELPKKSAPVSTSKTDQN